MDKLPSGKAPMFDLVGVGFGPSNLAVGAAVLDRATRLEPSKVKFLERKPHFSWHEDMLLEGVRMQVSFLKDLATMRNPSSRFTFLNYVFHAGRLSKFVNLRTFYPSRREFTEYLAWVAGELAQLAQYNADVRSIDPIVENGRVSALRVCYEDETGRSLTLGARNLILSTGPTPWMPFPVQDAVKDRAFHSSQFLSKAANISRASGSNVLVVGGGQSAVECALYLYSQAHVSRITLCSRGYTLRGVDDSHFANEVFSPESIDSWQRLDRRTRSDLLAEYKYSNYSAVDKGLLDKLYSILYEQSVDGDGKRLEVLTGTEMRALFPRGEVLECRLRQQYDSRAQYSRHFNYVVLATGYRTELDTRLIRNLRGILVRDEDGRYSSNRWYQLATPPEVSVKIFAFGVNEITHGIGDTLLSNMAVRAGEILASLETGAKSSAVA